MPARKVKKIFYTPEFTGSAASGARTARAKVGGPASGRLLANGTGRAATRGGGEVIELEHGITVYPTREESGPVGGRSGTRMASGGSARR
jgi:hypothetical protein